MPKIDLECIPQTSRTGYPEPHDRAVAGRWYRRLAPVAGLTEMGASHVTLKPGAWSSQRHWHAGVDELLIMLEGEAVLVEDDGETVLRPGDVAAWAKGVTNGHCLQNRGDADCSFVVVSAGDAANDEGSYPDIDMKFGPNGFTRKDGTSFPPRN
jgi:uncharacterized cupin superfamily protein